MSMHEMDYSFLQEGLKGSKQVKVSNMTNSRLVYSLEDPKVRREFSPAIQGKGMDIKHVTFHELYNLFQIPGGKYIILNSLRIHDNEIRGLFGIPQEPEYDMTLEDIKKLVMEGSFDEILDALEFGPVSLAAQMKSILVRNKVDSIDRRRFFESVFMMNLDTVESYIQAGLEGAATSGQFGDFVKAEQKTNGRRAGQAKAAETEAPKVGRVRRVQK